MQEKKVKVQQRPLFAAVRFVFNPPKSHNCTFLANILSLDILNYDLDL